MTRALALALMAVGVIALGFGAANPALNGLDLFGLALGLGGLWLFLRDALARTRNTLDRAPEFEASHFTHTDKDDL